MDVKIYINDQTEYSFCDFEEEMLAITEHFNEEWVITGNRHYKQYTEAAWYNKAKEVLDDLYSDLFTGASFRYYPEIDREQRKAIIEVFDNCIASNNLETIVDVANILYPEREFVTTTIRGYTQDEWQCMAYDRTNKGLLEQLESLYFGQMTAIHCVCDENNDDCWLMETNNNIWRMQRDGTLKETLSKWFGYDAKTDNVTIYVADGYIRKKKWKAVA